MDTSEIKHQTYKYFLGDENMAYATAEIADSTPTARQILTIGGYTPAAKHLLFQVLGNGRIVEIDLDATTDLTEAGKEHFIVFRSDRSYRFLLNDVRGEWGAEKMQVLVMKRLAHDGEAGEYDLYEERRGEPDKLVADTDIVVFGSSEVERYYTVKREAMVKVFIDRQEKKIPPGPYLVSKLKEVLGVPPEKELDQVVGGVLTPRDDDAAVTIVGCEEFFSHPRRGGSS